MNINLQWHYDDIPNSIEKEMILSEISLLKLRFESTSCDDGTNKSLQATPLINVIAYVKKLFFFMTFLY